MTFHFLINQPFRLNAILIIFGRIFYYLGTRTNFSKRINKEVVS